MIRVKPVLGITIFFFIEFLVIFSAPIYIQGAENKIESLIKFEKTVAVDPASGTPTDERCATAEESKDPDKINKCRDDAQKNAIKDFKEKALNSVFDSLKKEGFLEENFLKKLGKTEQDIRSGLDFEEETFKKQIIETKSYLCAFKGTVKVKISASFKEELLRIADKPKPPAVKPSESVVPTDSLSITITPAEAVKAGAKWKIEGRKWQDSGSSISGLLPGRYEVKFATISGWQTPANLPVDIERGKPYHGEGKYILQK